MAVPYQFNRFRQPASQDNIDYDVNPSSGNISPIGTQQGLAEQYAPGPTESSTGIASINPQSQNIGVLDTSSIDFGDVDQVKNIQRAIGVKDDGIWGSQTEQAYQTAINKRRTGAGMEAYQYGGQEEPGSQNQPLNREDIDRLLENQRNDPNMLIPGGGGQSTVPIQNQPEESGWWQNMWRNRPRLTKIIGKI